MRALLVSGIVIFVAFTTMAGPGVIFRVVELPRPNSGTFSFQQAEARKSEILSNIPSPKLERPDVHCGIHIEKDDTITVYNHFLKDIPAYSQPHTNQSLAQMVKMLDAVPRASAPLRVLITSDVQLKRSKTIHDVLKALFIPSIQLLYVSGSEQGGPANRSQPLRSDTNRMSSAAGPGR